MFNLEDIKEEMDRALRSRSREERFKEMSEFLEEKRKSGIAQRQEYTLPRIGTTHIPFGQSKTRGMANKK